MNYLDKKVLVLGLGESGLSAAQWLMRCGAVLRVADTREAPERLPQLMALCAAQESHCEFLSGQFSASLLDDIDFIVVSPGLSELNELQEIGPLAAERGIAMWSEIELFAQSLQHLRDTQQYQPKVLAITGTNGKTTVTSLVGLLVERSGKTVKVAGNISPAVLDVLRICVDENSLGVGAIQFSVTQHIQSASRCGHCAERDAGSSGLAWQHGSVCGRQIKNFCRSHRAGFKP